MKKQLLLFILFFLPFFVNAQLFVDNTTLTPAQLVQNVLSGGGVTITNVTFNGTAANANMVRDQVGFFTTDAQPTNLGLNSGLILSTGNAQAALGPNNNGGFTQATTTDNFPVQGDPDLFILAGNTIRNVCILEFDFVSSGPEIRFNFVFASEEYNEYVCADVNDSFGFFLRGPGITGPFSNNSKNIALVSGTNVPISINTVNNGMVGAFGDIVNCGNGSGLVNSAFFINNPQIATSTIQYDGFTTLITAVSDVECGETYHIKLAIANVGDNLFDSAVFLEAESFDSDPFDLGADYVESGGTALCVGDEGELNTGLDAAIPHEWYLGPDLIVGETGPIYTVTEPGDYTVIAYPFGLACPVSDTITIEFYPAIPVAEPIDLENCVANNVYDLTLNTPIVLNGLDSFQFELNYALTAEDIDFLNFIPNPSAYVSTGPGQTIYVSVVDIFSGSECISIQSFELIEVPCTLDPQSLDLVLCDEVTVGDDFEIFDLTQNNDEALNGLDPTLYEVTYHNTQPDANTGDFPISSANTYNGTNETIYVRVAEIAFPGNYGTDSFTLTVNPLPQISDVVATICSEETFTITPDSSGSNVIPTGTTYTWTVSSPVGITGASDETNPQTSISQTLTNTTAA
ncbi:choice-of-anchor L domain-containing protein, partial [Flavobacterium lacus]